MKIETKRLILRGWCIDDLDDLYEYAKNPNVGPNAGWKPHDNKEETLGILNNFIKDEDLWAIVYKENNKVIGSIGFNEDNLRGDINSKSLGYVLSEDYWGKGIMTEAAKSIIEYAFKVKKLDVLSVFHFTFNDRSRRVIEKCGFKYEGTLRKARKIYNGKIIDRMCYSILKEEYLK